MTQESRSVGQEIQAFSEGVREGVIALGKALNQDPATTGIHRSERLPDPVRDSFGEFKTKWTYLEGCDLGAELLGGNVGEVMVRVESDSGGHKVLGFGLTPREYDPTAGGRQIADAGEPGKFLLAIHRPGETEGTFRYLDEADLTGSVMRVGSGVSLAENTARRRQVQVKGVITKVVGLLEK